MTTPEPDERPRRIEDSGLFEIGRKPVAGDQDDHAEDDSGEKNPLDSPNRSRQGQRTKREFLNNQFPDEEE